MHQHSYAGLLPSPEAIRKAARLPLQAPPLLPGDFAVYLFHVAREIEGDSLLHRLAVAGDGHGDDQRRPEQGQQDDEGHIARKHVAP